jgi:GNAT superfamily N-acetyltransferase
MEFFLARRGTQIVGRIAAIFNRDHQRHHGDGAGFFGFFEAEKDQEVADALLDAASSWVRDRGCTHLLGPTSPSLNYESGLFVHGDEGPPHIMMPHNKAYYPELLEQSRCVKAQDLLAYYLHKDLIDTERWARMAERLRDRARVTVRTLDMARFRDEVRLIVDLFNDAWSANWGFVPMNEREIQHMATELRHLVRPELCAFVEREGEPVGFYLLLPNYNVILRTAKGRVLPFTLPRLLLAKRTLRAGRVLLMGVRRSFQHMGIDAVLNGEIVRACLAHGIDETESGWLLESNAAMINTLERVGSRHYRTYRVYRRDL